MGATIEIGSHGEQIAADYLEAEGFAIVDRNWRSGHCEIDIIAVRDHVLHIVEVKLRKKDGLTTPEQAITAAKFRSLCKAARSYIAVRGLDMEVQFDLVAIESHQQGFDIRYIPNAMTPRW